MADQSFLLVSLEGQKSKKLAEVIKNDTCRTILEALSKKEMTETELASSLGLPMSTVHYNLKNLVEAQLVVAEEYHYSTRGKEILHYKLANKLIIIAPKEEQAFKVTELLKKYFPVFGGIVAIGAIIDAFRLSLFSGVFGASSSMAKSVAMEQAAAAQEVAFEDARLIAASASETVVETVAASGPSPITGWFAGGALLALLIIFAIEFLKPRKPMKT